MKVPAQVSMGDCARVAPVWDLMRKILSPPEVRSSDPYLLSGMKHIPTFL